jgi:hypothetical protein
MGPKREPDTKTNQPTNTVRPLRENVALLYRNYSVARRKQKFVFVRKTQFICNL